MQKQSDFEWPCGHLTVPQIIALCPYVILISDVSHYWSPAQLVSDELRNSVRNFDELSQLVEVQALISERVKAHCDMLSETDRSIQLTIQYCPCGTIPHGGSDLLGTSDTLEKVMSVGYFLQNYGPQLKEVVRNSGILPVNELSQLMSMG